MRQGGQVPYQKSLKLQVVAHNEEQTYIDEKKENRTLVHAAVADATKAVKCTIYELIAIGICSFYDIFKKWDSNALKILLKILYHTQIIKY